MVSIQKNNSTVRTYQMDLENLEELVCWHQSRSLSNLLPATCSPSSRTYHEIQVLTACISANMQIHEILSLNDLDAVASNTLIPLQLAHAHQSGKVSLHSAKLQSNPGRILPDYLTAIKLYPARSISSCHRCRNLFTVQLWASISQLTFYNLNGIRYIVIQTHVPFLIATGITREHVQTNVCTQVSIWCSILFTIIWILLEAIQC